MPSTLFNCLTAEPAAEARPEIITPLGTLSLDAEFDGIVIGDLKPSSAYRLEAGGLLFNWTLDGMVAELLLCRPRSLLAEHMAVTNCWAGIWRLRATVSTFPGERPEFSCCWEPGYQWTEGGPYSGEGLDAQTWEDSQTMVTLGTIDCEWLSGQAERGLHPSRWADLLGASYGGIIPDTRNGRIDPIVYEKDGFRIVLPELNADETCQVQFVAAWAPKTDDEMIDASTWYAADQRPEDILSGAGCS